MGPTALGVPFDSRMEIIPSGTPTGLRAHVGCMKVYLRGLLGDSAGSCGNKREALLRPARLIAIEPTTASTASVSFFFGCQQPFAAARRATKPRRSRRSGSFHAARRAAYARRFLGRTTYAGVDSRWLCASVSCPVCLFPILSSLARRILVAVHAKPDSDRYRQPPPCACARRDDFRRWGRG